MELEPLPPDRPRAVSVVGWTGLVLGGIVALKSLVELAAWKILEPAIPALLGSSPRPPAELPLARAIYAHLTQIKLTEVAFWVFVAISCAALLRLRPWALAAVQIACTILIVYIACMAAVWVVAWSATASAAGAPAVPYRIGILVAACGFCIVLAGVLTIAIRALRTDAVRSAFAANR